MAWSWSWTDRTFTKKIGPVLKGPAVRPYTNSIHIYYNINIICKYTTMVVIFIGLVNWDKSTHSSIMAIRLNRHLYYLSEIEEMLKEPVTNLLIDEERSRTKKEIKKGA